MSKGEFSVFMPIRLKKRGGRKMVLVLEGKAQLVVANRYYRSPPWLKLWYVLTYGNASQIRSISKPCRTYAMRTKLQPNMCS